MPARLSGCCCGTLATNTLALLRPQHNVDQMLEHGPHPALEKFYPRAWMGIDNEGLCKALWGWRREVGVLWHVHGRESTGTAHHQPASCGVDRPVYYECMGAVDMKSMLRIASRREVEEFKVYTSEYGQKLLRDQSEKLGRHIGKHNVIVDLKGLGGYPKLDPGCRGGRQPFAFWLVRTPVPADRLRLLLSRGGV